ncbi:MAG: hypothetical protein FWG75_10790 [Cystobacterineae bacterium]|nr:hypothetical protein [Cystobacterineae bacterium]
MKTDKFFAMGMLLPLLAAWSYAGEAGATTTAGKDEIVITSKKTKLDVLGYGKLPVKTDPNRYDTEVLIIKLPLYYELSSIKCSLKSPGEAHYFTEQQCGKILHGGVELKKLAGKIGTFILQFTELPVKQGVNEFHVQVTATLKSCAPLKYVGAATKTATHMSRWFVHMLNPPGPKASSHTSNGNVAAKPGADGKCSPVIIPIEVEHEAKLSYKVNGGPIKTATAPASPPLLPGYVAYELKLLDAMLNAGETLSLELWFNDHLGGEKSQHVLWTVECPSEAFVVVEEKPEDGHSSKVSFRFSIFGAVAQLMCSLNGKVELCQSLLSHTYENLKEGTYIFKVYPAENPKAVVEHCWTVSLPKIKIEKVPAENTSKTAVFEFGIVGSLNVEWECRLNGSPIACEGSSLVLKNLEEGEHVLEVRVKGSLGEEGLSSYAWEVYAEGSSLTGEGQSTEESAMELVVSSQGGCSAAAGLPLGFVAVAGFLALARRRNRS